MLYLFDFCWANDSAEKQLRPANASDKVFVCLFKDVKQIRWKSGKQRVNAGGKTQQIKEQKGECYNFT